MAPKCKRQNTADEHDHSQDNKKRRSSPGHEKEHMHPEQASYSPWKVSDAWVRYTIDRHDWGTPKNLSELKALVTQIPEHVKVARGLKQTSASAMSPLTIPRATRLPRRARRRFSEQ